MYRINSLICVYFLSFCALSSQSYSNKEIEQMGKLIAEKIRENYVLSHKGEKIADYFLNDLREGRFYGAESLKKLDSVMCKSLKEISNDPHLYVWNNLDVVKEVKDRENAKNKESSEASKSEEEVTTFFNNEKARISNYGFSKVEILPNNIGYINLSSINISGESLRKVYAAMTFVEDTDYLIIDLRDNPGGGSTLGCVLESYFFKKHIELLEFRNRSGSIEKSETVGWILNKKYLNPLYILINKGTGSAAEAFAFSLQGQNRAIIVGEPSSGGAYMNDYFLINDDFVLAVSTSAPFLIGTNISWEGKGVQPDIEVQSDKVLDKVIDLINSK